MWLGRYEEPLPLRCRGPFHAYAARQDGEGVVVVIPGDPLPGPAAAGCLERLGRAHRVLDGTDGIVRFREAGRFEATPFVAFTCDAACDGEALIARLADAGARVTYAEAMAAVDRITAGLAEAHDRVDPEDDAPLVLGAFSWANVIVDRQGGLHLFGFGHNVCAFNELGGSSGAPAVFVAPEVAAGRKATPGADLYAFVVMQRALMSFADVPAAVARAFAGEQVDDVDREMHAIIRWVDENVVSAPAARRASMRAARAKWEAETRLLGVRADYAALRARLTALLRADDAPEPSARGARSDALTVNDDASSLRTPDGNTFTIDRRPVRRLLRELVRLRRAAPGQYLEPDALIEAGWPGERPIREAGLNRVYVAMSLLRKLGLRDLLQRDERGYRIDPSVAVRVEVAGGAATASR